MKFRFRLPEPFDTPDERRDFSGEWYRELRRQYGVEWLTFLLQILTSEGVKRGDLVITATFWSNPNANADPMCSPRLKVDDVGYDHGVGFRSYKWGICISTNPKKVRDKCSGRLMEIPKITRKAKGPRFRCDTCKWSNYWPTSYHFAR